MRAMPTLSTERPTALWRLWRWVGSVLALLCASAQAAEAPVTLHYIQRPPYMMAQGEGLVGLTGGPSYQAFKAARVPVQVQETPFARQLLYLKNNSGLDCMIGMFWKAERAAFARYSKPIYQDQPQLILTSADQARRFEPIGTVEALFSDKSLRLLVKLGYSYGGPLDALIERLQPTRRATPDENLHMVRQIKLGMADYMLMAPEEAAVAIEAAGYARSDFALIRFKSMPPGEPRHLLCSQRVPEDVMRRLDAAIKKAGDTERGGSASP